MMERLLWTESVFSQSLQPISGEVDRATDTETVDSISTPDRIKSKTIKIGIHSFPALLDVQQLKGQCEASTVCD